MEKERIELLSYIYRSLSNGIRSAKANAPREWLAQKGLSVEVTGACFNSGQIHHRKEQSFKDSLEQIGFIKRSDVPTNAGQIPYTVFGIYSVIFPLRDEDSRVVNFYAASLKKEKTEYMNQEGIYPSYPHAMTERLFITEDILDAATLLEAKVLDNREAVIALHDGKLMPQHSGAISSLKVLKEIILITKKEEHERQRKTA
jgi:hypothetical protein